MYQITVCDKRGTYYPIAFFNNESEANTFAVDITPRWGSVTVEPIKSAVIGIMIDAASWRVIK